MRVFICEYALYVGLDQVYYISLCVLVLIHSWDYYVVADRCSAGRRRSGGHRQPQAAQVARAGAFQGHPHHRQGHARVGRIGMLLITACALVVCVCVFLCMGLVAIDNLKLLKSFVHGLPCHR